MITMLMPSAGQNAPTASDAKGQANSTPTGTGGDSFANLIQMLSTTGVNTSSANEQLVATQQTTVTRLPTSMTLDSEKTAQLQALADELGLEAPMEDIEQWLDGWQASQQAGEDPKAWLQALVQDSPAEEVASVTETTTPMPIVQEILDQKPALNNALTKLSENIQSGIESLERVADKIDNALNKLQAWQPQLSASSLATGSGGGDIQAQARPMPLLTPEAPPPTLQAPPAADAATKPLVGNVVSPPNSGGVVTQSQVVATPEPSEVEGMSPNQRIDATVTTSITQTINAAPGSFVLPEALTSGLLKAQHNHLMERAALEASALANKVESMMIGNASSQGGMGQQMGGGGQQPSTGGESGFAQAQAQISADTSAEAALKGEFSTALDAQKADSSLKNPILSAAKGPRLSLGQEFGKPGWQDAMGARVKWMNNAGVQKAVVHLDPAELGHIEVSIELAEEQTKISFHAENAQARETLEQSSARLKEALLAAGFDDVGVDVGGQNAQSPEEEAEQALAKGQEGREGEEVMVSDAPAGQVRPLPLNSTISTWA